VVTGLHSLRHAAITTALDAGEPLRDAQTLARHADPRTTQHYDRARGNLDRHAVHFLTAYVAGVYPASNHPECSKWRTGLCWAS
jgi:integrase/recombinase XerD